jgi:hypothetical protein
MSSHTTCQIFEAIVNLRQAIIFHPAYCPDLTQLNNPHIFILLEINILNLMDEDDGFSLAA